MNATHCMISALAALSLVACGSSSDLFFLL